MAIDKNITRLVRYKETNPIDGTVAGDIFEVVAGGTPLEVDEGYKTIWDIIDITGTSVRAMRRVKQSQFRPATVVDKEWSNPDEEDKIVFVSRHRWNISESNLTDSERTELEAGKLTIDLKSARINQIILDKEGKRLFVRGN